MDGGDLLFPADLPDQGHGPGIQLEDRAAVDDLQIAEFPGNHGKHPAVQGKVGIFVSAFVGVVVAERTFPVDASAAPQQDDLPLEFCCISP